MSAAEKLLYIRKAGSAKTQNPKWEEETRKQNKSNSNAKQLSFKKTIFFFTRP